jgi:cytochrome c553
MKAILILSLLMSLSSFSQDVKKGKKIFKKVKCSQCHNKDGMGKAKLSKKTGKIRLNAMKSSRIAGLPAAYIEAQMIAIQAKSKDKKTHRKTKYSASMKAKIKKLSPQDIKDVAAYVSTMQPKKGEYKSEIWPRDK